MPTVEAEFEIYCTCGAGLCFNVTEDRNNKVVMSPCEKCIESAKDEGYREGYDQAEKDYNK